jgi:hypothetical protein
VPNAGRSLPSQQHYQPCMQRPPQGHLLARRCGAAEDLERATAARPALQRCYGTPPGTHTGQNEPFSWQDRTVAMLPSSLRTCNKVPAHPGSMQCHDVVAATLHTQQLELQRLQIAAVPGIQLNMWQAVRTRAAVRIQAAWRGCSVRRRLLQHACAQVRRRGAASAMQQRLPALVCMDLGAPMAALDHAGPASRIGNRPQLYIIGCHPDMQRPRDPRQRQHPQLTHQRRGHTCDGKGRGADCQCLQPVSRDQLG